MIRKYMRFTGHVQGVGFRCRAKYVAQGLGITGWVQNEWDGSVEMEVQGTSEQINQMLKMINQSEYIVIDCITTEELQLNEPEKGFHVR